MSDRLYPGILPGKSKACVCNTQWREHALAFCVQLGQSDHSVVKVVKPCIANTMKYAKHPATHRLPSVRERCVTSHVHSIYVLR